MKMVENVRDFIQHLTRKDMIKWSMIYVGFCAAIITGIIVRHLYMDTELNGKITQLNKARQQLQKIFTEFQATQAEKIKVNELLSKNKNFNIQKYFQNISNQERIATQSVARFESEKLSNGYTQESLQITISSISTEQLCQLLTIFEQEPLLFIHFVDITGMPQSKKINVSLKLATLRLED